MVSRYLFSVLLSASLSWAWAETAVSTPRALTPEDLREWRKLTTTRISDNGAWVVAVNEPTHADGARDGSVDPLTSDPHMQLFDSKGKLWAEFCPVSKVEFSYSSQYLVLSTRVPDACKDLRSKKALEKLPMDTLRILTLGKSAIQTEVIDSLRSFKMAGELDWIAFQRLKKDSTLHVRPLGDTTEIRLGRVKEYGFSKKGGSLYWLTDTAIWMMDCRNRIPLLVKQGKGKFSKITFDEQGRQLAFLYSNAAKGALAGTGVSLWRAEVPDAIAGSTAKALSESAAQAEQLTDSINEAFPEGWVVSPNGSLNFSKKGDRLFFGTAPAPRATDTIHAVSSRPNVQVWSWDEPEEYLVQETTKERRAKKTFLAMYQRDSRTITQLADKEFPTVIGGREYEGDWALLRRTEPYSISSMWEAMSRADYMAVSLQTGERRLVREADFTSYTLSPSGRYAVGYSETDSLWRSLDLATGASYDLTSPRTFVCWDVENDVPFYPNAAGKAYWTSDERYLLIGDGYDFWRVPVTGGDRQRITTNGREQGIRYSLLELDNELRGKYVDDRAMQYLEGFHEADRSYGYYAMKNMQKPAAPATLLHEDCMYASLKKAQRGKTLIFTKQSFAFVPDLWMADSRFGKPMQLTQLVRQQDGIRWGTAEMVHWTSYKGIALDGMLFKPADFDPSRKYPLIVNFYERYSNTINSARTPGPNRSGPDYHMYLSQGYVIFNPDVRYTDGHPGESCYDCVMSGIDAVCALGFIDENRIGASGHSWGGYQVAWLATRTDRFAAIESGAPVVNMFSAYGGIRWATGRARAFQYEHTQSRLGTTMWEHPEIYTENSPLMQLDKVQTPILIMANDTDGHVPYTQGIEMFVAMKRLGKPCWLLNYTGEPHWPCKTANRVDFQHRLLHFFNHYLKGEPMPAWMSEGIRAVDQPYELGY